MTYNSRLAQELASGPIHSHGEEIHDAMFQAYFVDNVNLAKIENLIKIAARVGLPAAETERVLVERQFRDAVDADWQRSRALGITGVPTFVIGDRGLVRAQPYEELEAFVSMTGFGGNGMPSFAKAKLRKPRSKGALWRQKSSILDRCHHAADKSFGIK